jgi:ribosomal protein S12 methylthiotransferase
MKRPADAEDTLARIQAWRRQCPEIALRSTFIVGFPGETEAEFESLLEFLEEAELDRVGCFAYSPVQGAAANELPGAVPEEVKAERVERFMLAQADISARRLAARVGQSMEVLIDEVDDSGAIGRSYAEAPEIDGIIAIPGASGIKPGDVVKARAVGATEHDLEAELI